MTKQHRRVRSLATWFGEQFGRKETRTRLASRRAKHTSFQFASRFPQRSTPLALLRRIIDIMLTNLAATAESQDGLPRLSVGTVSRTR
jgi:hypothetical protein